MTYRTRFYRWLIEKSHHHFYPYAWMVTIFDRFGIEFIWKGDTVIWSWPWRKRRDRARGAFISLGFSGTGEFGDARFKTLKELDDEWSKFFDSCPKADPTYFSKEG